MNQAFSSSNEHELNRTFTTKKPSISQPTSARIPSPSRIPLPVSARKVPNDDTQIVQINDKPVSRSLPPVPLVRSKTIHNDTLQSTSDETNILRSYKVHLEQVLRKDVSDIKIPNYTSIEDVIKANEVLI